MDIHNSDIKNVRLALQTLREIGPAPDGDGTLADGDILNLTTAAGLIAAINAKAGVDRESPLKHREAIESVQEMSDRGIFVDGGGNNIDNANTFAGLLAILTAILPTSEAEVQASYYGATDYLGNGGPASTL